MARSPARQLGQDTVASLAQGVGSLWSAFPPWQGFGGAAVGSPLGGADVQCRANGGADFVGLLGPLGAAAWPGSQIALAALGVASCGGSMVVAAWGGSMAREPNCAGRSAGGVIAAGVFGVYVGLSGHGGAVEVSGQERGGGS
jgi:hypothetical protein